MNLFGLTLSELQEICLANSLQKFVAKQMCDWLYKKRCRSIDDMTNLSLKATKDIKVTDSFSIPVFGQLVGNPCSQKAYLVFGITLQP